MAASPDTNRVRHRLHDCTGPGLSPGAHLSSRPKTGSAGEERPDNRAMATRPA